MKKFKDYQWCGRVQVVAVDVEVFVVPIDGRSDGVA
ncbi:hypothetical protein Tco_0993650, partial [Tanacetum coccineum]